MIKLVIDSKNQTKTKLVHLFLQWRHAPQSEKKAHSPQAVFE